MGEQVKISENDECHIKEVGFQDVFSDKDQWFDQYRFKKMMYWNETVQKLSIAFVRKIREDGYILRAPHRCLLSSAKTIR